MNYLDYQSVLSCAATSRMMLRDVMPRVTTIHIEKACELNARLVPRFHDVREIKIYSLLVESSEFDIGEDDEVVNYYTVNHDSLMRAVPFLARFPNLELVFLGGKRSNGKIVSFCPDDKLLNEEVDVERSSSLIDMISGSFRCGGLSDNVRVSGLRCPCSKSAQEDEISDCGVCKRACNSFPLDQVINFHSNGSSESNGDEFSTERPCCLDVCLPRSQIESIVEARPGGHALLRSDARFLHLLGRGSRYVIPDNDGVPFHVVIYSEKEIDELKRVIEYAQLDVKGMESERLTMAIMQSFAKDDKGKIPPRSQCYLANKSFIELKGEMGLPISLEDFYPDYCYKNNLPQIGEAIMSDNVLVQEECTVLLVHMLDDVEKPHVKPLIRRIVNMGVVPELVELLRSNKQPRVQRMSAFALGRIALKGTIAHTEVVVDAGAIPKLVRLLGSTNYRLAARESAHVLGKIASRSSAFQDRVLKARAVPPLLSLLKKFNDISVLEVVSWTLWKLCIRDISSGEIPLGCARTKHYIKTKPCLEPLAEILLNNQDTNLKDEPQGSKQLQEIVKNVCWALYYICCGPSEATRVVIKAGPLPRLMELSDNSECIAHDPASKITEIIATRDSVWTKPIVNINDLPMLMLFMSSSEDEHVQKVAARAVCNIIIFGSKEQIWTATDVIPELIEMLAGKDMAIQTDAVYALCKISERGTAAQIKVLASQDCIRPLCCFLADGDATIVGHALRALRKVSIPFLLWCFLCLSLI